MSNQKESCVILYPHASQYAKLTHLHCPKQKGPILHKNKKNILVIPGHSYDTGTSFVAFTSIKRAVPVAPVPVAPVAPFHEAQPQRSC